MPKKHKLDTTISDDEKAIFRQAMRGVKPLSAKSLPKPLKVFKRTNIKIHKPETNEACEFPFSDYEKLAAVSSEDSIEYSRNGIANKKLRKLRQGQYNVDAILDLHGQTVAEAKKSLSDFLLRCQQNAVNIALISHGKGRFSQKPVLKNKLNHWLRQLDQVLAFCSAHHGGALYVLLKKRGRLS